jgi:hypothetical protein
MKYSSFTKRQLWRRTLSHVHSRSQLSPNDSFSSSSNSGRNSVEEEVEEENEYVEGTSSLIPKELMSHVFSSSDLPIRNVHFNNIIQVCFIEDRKESGPALKELYWHQEDFDMFKQEAVNEIRTYWRLSGTSAKEAIARLYQPELEDELVQCIFYHSEMQLTMYAHPSMSSGIEGDEEEMKIAITTATTENDFTFGTDDQTTRDEITLGIGETVMRHVDSLSCLVSVAEPEETDSESSATSSHNSPPSSHHHHHHSMSEDNLNQKKQDDNNWNSALIIIPTMIWIR